jgi:hypothetical protein
VASEVKSRISVPVVIVLMVALAALGLWWHFASQPRDAPGPAAITPEAKAYVRNLRLSGVEMKATQNFAGGTVVEIIGNITNGGDRTLNRVELNCVFYDAYGQLVLRERVPIVRSALEPQAQRAFRLPFEGIPESWNQALPQLVIASISFAQ